MEFERSHFDYGQNCIGYQQFITNTATSAKYVTRLSHFLHWQLDSKVTQGANSLEVVEKIRFTKCRYS